MSAEYKVTKEFTRENIKLKISGKSVVRAWRNRGKFAPRMGCANVVRVLCEFRTSFAQAEGVVRISRCCANFAQAWSSCLTKAISSSFQLQIVHGLKRWILTSWDLKWYIECRKWTSGSAPKVRRKTEATVLCFLHFLFASLLCLACLNDPKSCQNTKTSHKYD